MGVAGIWRNRKKCRAEENHGGELGGERRMREERKVREGVRATLNGMKVTRRNEERKLRVCVILSGVERGREAERGRKSEMRPGEGREEVWV